MTKIRLRRARDNSQWLTLIAGLLIATVTIGMTVLSPPESQAADAGADLDPWPLAGDYASPRRCRECHEAEFQAWSHTAHADASFDPVFQVYWQQEQESTDCFSCHTTGYDYTTGQFALAGVTCEACHGPYRPDHPDESMAVAASEDLCGSCHTSTVAEWQSSRHGQIGVACTACHKVHMQKTRLADNRNALCAECHREQIQEPIHTVQGHGQAQVHCVDCHLARATDDASAMVKGQAITGHSFSVLVSTCDDCHPVPLTPDTVSP